MKEFVLLVFKTLNSTPLNIDHLVNTAPASQQQYIRFTMETSVKW